MKNNDQIHVRAEFTIEKGKIEEFKKLIEVMSRMVENNEPDTLCYRFYLTFNQYIFVLAMINVSDFHG
jgi:hypothetical protein